MNPLREFIGVGIFAAGLVFGYFAGTRAQNVTIQTPQTPSNYDSARAIATDAIKLANDSQDRCWKAVIQLRTEATHHE